MFLGRAAAGLVLLPILLTQSGCGKLREVSACRSLTREVNGALDEIEIMSKAKPFDEVRIANRYGALAKALEPRAVGESPLAQAVRDYIAVLKGTEKSLKDHDQANKTPYGRIQDPRRELERVVKRERAAVIRIDVECHK